jgi:ABC-2 type transport system ATP-binding protein
MLGINLSKKSHVLPEPTLPAFMIQAQNLSKNFDGKRNQALVDLNLSVPKGQIFGMIGVNGAGKSTALKIMATILPPDRGDVLVAGHSVRAEPDTVRRLIGYVPDDYGLYAEMQVDEYLEFFAACYGIHNKKRVRLVNQLLDLVDLQSRRSQLLKGLSRGMKQRLCLAHALVHDPQVLLLDEPASGLDPHARVEMRELLHELAAMGKTVVISSHALEDVRDICDAVAIMAKGHLLESGPTAEVAAKGVAGLLSRQLTIRVVSDTDFERALILASTFPQLDAATLQADTAKHYIQVDINGAEEVCAAFLSYLTGNGVAVAHFTQKGNGLEEFFAGEV